MSRKNHTGRSAVMAAAQIHEQLLQPSLAMNWLEVPQEAWEELNRIAQLLRRALAKEWYHAAQQLLVDLDYPARRVARDVEKLAANLPQRVGRSHIAAVSEIAADVIALASEFTDVSINEAEQTLSVVTDSIELERLDLGPFKIILHWDCSAQRQIV